MLNPHESSRINKVQNIVLPFNPNINDIIFRLIEIEKALKYIEEKTNFNTELSESLTENLTAEYDFCIEKIISAWEALPEISETDETTKEQFVNPYATDDGFEEIIYQEKSKPHKNNNIEKLKVRGKNRKS